MSKTSLTFEEKLADQLEQLLDHQPGITKKKMFGGICYLHYGNMLCGIAKGKFVARVGPDAYDKCLAQKHAREMDFTGRPMRGMVYVSKDGLKSITSLKKWVQYCENFVHTLAKK